MTAQDSLPVPPDAVRVWRGFRSPALSTGEFHNELGATFLPATVKMQSNAGLCSYIPTVVAGLPGKPDSAPDETAILFWGSQTAYRNSFNRLAVRIYTLTHNGVYAIQNHQSRADFPVLFKAGLSLINQAISLKSRRTGCVGLSITWSPPALRLPSRQHFRRPSRTRWPISRSRTG